MLANLRKLLTAFALLMVLQVQAARLALVIGNDNYTQVSKLQKAGNDAAAMARELKAAGFAVQLHRDLNYLSMVKAVENFTSSIKGGDEVVVFFAGHGVQIKSGAYLLPTDIEGATSESQVERTAYDLNALTEKLGEAKAAFSLVMVDACRNNPLKANGRTVGSTRGLSAVEPPKGQMVVYSASKGQTALDTLSDKDSNPNSVFTREFIGRMKKPGIRIEELMREVQDAVEALAGTVKHEQRPALYNEARGNFYFFGPTTVQKLPDRVETSDAEIESQGWSAAQRANTEAGYAAYLQEYPKGRFAAAARIARASLGLAPLAPQLTVASPAAQVATPEAVPQGDIDWIVLPGAAVDIGVGANGVLWVTNAEGGIYRWINGAWNQMPGAAVRVSVDPQGNAWVVNSGSGIYRWTGGTWVQQPGGLSDIGVGANGTVWGVNAGGFIYRWTGSSWTQMPGAAVRVSVDPQGNAWVVTSAGGIYLWTGSTWVQKPGAAKDVAACHNGDVYVIGTENALYKWNGANWDKKSNRALQNIACDAQGNIYATTTSQMILKATYTAALSPVAVHSK